MAKKKNKKRKASAKPVRAAARRRPKKSVEQLISEIPAARVKFDDSIKQLEVGDMKALNKSLVAATDIKQILHDLKDHELADQPPGMWDIPGGRLDQGEDMEQGFRREIKEEIGLSEIEITSVVDYDIWVNPQGVPVCAIANLIKQDEGQIVLSDEHRSYAWVAENEIDNYRFLWPQAPRMLKKAFLYTKLTNNKAKL